MTDKRYTSPVAAEDVTGEMIEIVQGIVDGWYSEGRVDWEDVWDRADGSRLDDGSYLDLGTDMSSPALLRLKREAKRNY